jgi:hypothetical protein
VQPTRTEIWITGILAALLTIGQAVFVAVAAFVIVAISLGWRSDLPVNTTAVLLCFIIGAGAYFPVVVLVGSFSQDTISKSEGDTWARRFVRFGPVALFVFWCRHIRPKARTG